MNETVRHLRELRLNYQNRLRELELMRANFGFNTPPEINIEIRDLEEKIKNIDNNIQLNQEGAGSASTSENPTSSFSSAENRKEPFTTSRTNGDVYNNTINNGSFFNSNVHVGDQHYTINNVTYDHLSNIITEEEQDFSQIISIIEELEINTRQIAFKLNDFNIDADRLLSNVNNISRNELKSNFQDILVNFENSILLYTLSVNKINRQYEVAIRSMEAILKKLLNIDYLKVRIPRKEVYDFVSSINEFQGKLFILRSILMELLQALRKIAVPETINSTLTKTLEVCIENISNFDTLIEKHQHLLWRTRGMAKGLLDSVD